MSTLRPDPQRWRIARRQVRLQQAQDRLDPALGSEFERLLLGERLELALSVGRNVLGFALRDCLEVQTRYALAPSYSESISQGAAALAEHVTALLARLEGALASCEGLLALPESEWARWSPPAAGPSHGGAGPAGPDLPQSRG